MNNKSKSKKQKAKGGQVSLFDGDGFGFDASRKIVGRDRKPKLKIQKPKIKTANFGRKSGVARGGMSAIGDVLDRYKIEDKGGYISQEFQDFGYRLAMELGDLKHKALYMKLAKKEDRVLLEKALSFVKDAGAKNPGALFMWKLKDLKNQKLNAKNQSDKENSKKSG